jgi:hypothetical protein
MAISPFLINGQGINQGTQKLISQRINNPMNKWANEQTILKRRCIKWESPFSLSMWGGQEMFFLFFLYPLLSYYAKFLS